ncbi:hypothetical protein DF143_32755 [Burkholderia cenocepacia]|nr:hypothetical protein DF143_32755 [Burkholderia cenocepacia]RQV35067.1 hypothetical protein DF033_32090 [Burkholderia cenocepacia]
MQLAQNRLQVMASVTHPHMNPVALRTLVRCIQVFLLASATAALSSRAQTLEVELPILQDDLRVYG